MAEQQYTVVVTKEAKQNLKSIVSYLLESTSKETAEKVRDGIEAQIASLSTMPHAHGLLKITSQKAFVYRRVLKWSYRIIYTINESEILVLVVRIDHEKINPDALDNLP